MIRPLRQRHRWIMCALGLGLPLAFAAGIAARKPVPVAASIPPELRPARFEGGVVVWTKTDLWPGQGVTARLRQDAAGSAALELAFDDLLKPDVLVYWVGGDAAAPDRLPHEARLIGALSNRVPLPIPTAMRSERGRFWLYSLANHEVVAASKPLTL